MSLSMSRRNLLRGGTMLSASAFLSNPGFAFAGENKSASSSPIRLGIASYTFRNFDQAHLIDFMKQLKTAYLNLKDTHLPMTPLDQVATKAAEYRAAGMTLTALGTIYFPKDDDDDIRAKFEYCKAAGVSLIVGAPTHETLPRVEKFVKEYNIRVGIHNHGPEDKQWPSPLTVLDAVKDMDPRMGCCIDVGHTMRTGTDVVDAIRKAGPRLFDIHMKDLAQSNVKESQVAVGDGLMPVPQIFKALIEMRYPGQVDLEYEIFPSDPLPGVIKSFAYMRGVLAGMGYKG
ncbi:MULTISPECIES: sugar phosphate isomerase/epimerase [Acidobacteriaceae]|uniref:sugar phosphate isomerase/epimerase family protein n=1 Tax=Acidobacteriaceae TaxID=204434 RepID=UPI00131A90CF|nr:MULTISPECIES: sugar phosphate isomerase/epimerase [Acidobacteriaceae]MDW5264609.1 sugar phosphate isomerase/epimerase [Edaphobacter sp.]